MATTNDFTIFQECEHLSRQRISPKAHSSSACDQNDELYDFMTSCEVDDDMMRDIVYQYEIMHLIKNKIQKKQKIQKYKHLHVWFAFYDPVCHKFIKDCVDKHLHTELDVTDTDIVELQFLSPYQRKKAAWNNYYDFLVNNYKNTNVCTDYESLDESLHESKLYTQISMYNDVEFDYDTDDAVDTYIEIQSKKYPMLVNDTFTQSDIVVILSLHIPGIISSRNYVELIANGFKFLDALRGRPILSDSTLWSFIEKSFNDILDYDPMKQDLESFVNMSRNYLDRYDTLRESPLFTKVYRLMMFCLTYSVFEKLNITFDTMGYNKLEAEAIKCKFHLRTEFLRSLIDTLIFILERGIQIYKTGEITALFHSGTSYETWFDTFIDLKKKYVFINDPEANGFKECVFVETLEKAIEQGESMRKFSKRTGVDTKFLNGHLAELIQIQASLRTRKFASQTRDPPFTLLLCGESGIGKSTIRDMIFDYFGKLCDLPLGDEYKYNRVPTDEYWSNFRTQMWFISMDDVAYLNPRVATAGGDKSVIEFLQIVNPTPFTPPQAAIEDKGKTPVRAKLVIATSNSITMNTEYYFSFPCAAQRRFPFIVEPVLKEGFEDPSTGVLCPPSDHVQNSGYPDYWTFNVIFVKPVKLNDPRKLAQMERPEHLQKMSLQQFLKWLKHTVKHYQQNLKVMASSNKLITETQLCKDCLLPPQVCECEVGTETQNFIEQNATITVPGNQESKFLVLLSEVMDHVSNHYATYAWGSCFVWLAIMFLRAISNLYRFGMRVRNGEWWLSIVLSYLWNRFLISILGKDLYGYYTQYNLSLSKLMRIMYSIKNRDYAKVMRVYYSSLGERTQRAIYYSPYIVATLGVLYSISKLQKLSSMMSRTTESSSKDEVREKAEVATTTLNTKSTVDSEEVKRGLIGTRPEPDNEKKNPWKDDDLVTTSYDIGYKTTGWKQLSRANLIKSIEKNIVMICTTTGDLISSTGAIALYGHWFVANYHGINFQKDGSVHMTMIRHPIRSTVGPNVTIILSSKDYICDKVRDCFFFYVLNTPPCKDIRDLLPKQHFNAKGNGFSMLRRENGEIFVDDIIDMHRLKPGNYKAFSYDTFIPRFGGERVKVETAKGDCGAPWIMESGYGPVLIGLHIAGEKKWSECLILDQEYITDKLPKTPSVSDSGFDLSSDTAEVQVSTLAPKANIRYLDDGVAEVYGSLSGFRGQFKSSVEPTPIAKSLAKHGVEIKHTSPEMTSWKPWNIALTDIVNPVWRVNNDILSECVNDFYNSIKNALPASELEKLCIYDDFTAINGAASVTYVDRIKRTSSAGFPWKRSKRFFLSDAPPQGDNLNPVDIDDEMKGRVRSIIAKYQAGNRAFPVFSASLKDEPVEIKKKQMGKTRVFCGAPFDWIIVVRKYLLSFIRVAQRNRYIFEMAPGMNHDSSEWHELYDYLVAFGEDRIIAGDYKSYDKRMSPIFIHAAYRIIMMLCRDSGNFQHRDLLTIMGICEDTAYPLVDCNGDLIQFYGSNPSGHPLTVIINSLVNSLYMRYAFIALNKTGRHLSFKDHVHLMTYGDDNIMGTDIDFFNHTAIVEVFKTMDITYTMADKTAESVPYIHINEASFLKRKWRFDRELLLMTSPLEIDSIFRSLTCWVKNKNQTVDDHLAEVVKNALYEAFLHGMDYFKTFRKLLVKAMKDYNSSINWYYKLPTYMDILKDFVIRRDKNMTEYEMYLIEQKYFAIMEEDFPGCLLEIPIEL